MSAVAGLYRDLMSKPRTGWEKNGFEDGRRGVVRTPVGSTAFATDTYRAGWYAGEQSRLMEEANCFVWRNDALVWDQPKP